MQKRGRSKTPAAKRSRSTRSKSTRRSLGASFGKTTKAITSPSVGLGQSAKTVLKTDIFYQALFDAQGLIRLALKPGSAFDPTGDASGIQPALYDQWAATYGRYVVEKATVILEFSNSSASSSTTVYSYVAAAYPSINATALSTYQGAASQPYAKTLLHGPYDNSTTSTLTFKLDHAKVLGRKGMVTAEDNGALTGADPATGQYMVLPIFINSSAATATQSGVTIRIRMFQTVHFDRRINVVDA